MAPAADDAADVEEKSVFRCLDAARYVVAAVVTVLIVAVIVYAITVVFRPGDLYLGVVGGSVSISTSGGDKLGRPFNASIRGDNLTFSFTVRAFNPSGRVSIYYKNITAMLKSNLSSSSFLTLYLPNMALGPQAMVDTNILMNTFVRVPDQAYYFKLLANGSSIDDAMIMLNGTRFDEVNSGHYTNIKMHALYYCSHIAVGGDKEDDGTAADVRCKDENQLGSS